MIQVKQVRNLVILQDHTERPYVTRSDGSKQLERLRDLKVRRRQKMNGKDKYAFEILELAKEITGEA